MTEALPDIDVVARDDQPDWIRALRIYLAAILVGNLVWESLQLPLYTIWREGTLREQAFAVLHCTGGDLLIAASALSLALVLAGNPRWPQRGFVQVAALTILLATGYTVFSEWLNVVVRASWQYSALMPVLPGLGTGVSPLLQWAIVPWIALWCARRAARRIAA